MLGDSPLGLNDWLGLAAEMLGLAALGLTLGLKLADGLAALILGLNEILADGLALNDADGEAALILGLMDAL